MTGDRTPGGDLRERLAQALHCPTCGVEPGEHCLRARDDNRQPHMTRVQAADAVLPVVEAETADRPDWRPAYDRLAHALTEALTRAETAERQHAEALDQIATERRGRLAAEAAARRVRQVLARKTLLAGPQAEKAVRVADVEAALDPEQPKETP